MSERVHKWLFDIQISIEEIESFYSEIKTYNFFVSDKIRKKATERNLEIIGEAMNRILNENKDINITNAKRIIGLRNIIIHGYDSISYENIWSIIINHLPKLKEEVEELLREF